MAKYSSGVTKVVESRDWSKDDIDRVVSKLKNERELAIVFCYVAFLEQDFLKVSIMMMACLVQ